MNRENTKLSALLLYCRRGFEKECAGEIHEKTQALGIEGYSNAKPDSGFVLFTAHDPEALPRLYAELRFKELIFARQMVFVLPLLNDLPVNDRATPLIEAAKKLAGQFSEILLETADTNEAKELSVFVKKFSGHFEKAALSADLIGTKKSSPRLHVFFLNSANAYVGISRPNNSSPYFMGIPRLKFPRAAPSRSTLKLDEAFLHFLDENAKNLQPGMSAVDLGAAPGGWTWQLVKRSIRVIAVDNGPMDPALLDSGIVEHIKADGFRYKPNKPVDWLVCDMIEQPSRISQLIAQWFVEGHCRHSIFNLKLPMKKRLDAVNQCKAIIESKLDDAEIPFKLAFKQLYHDREEVTAYLTRLK